MSLNNILYSPNPSPSWSNLRVNSLTVDSDIVLSNTAQAVISGTVSTTYTLPPIVAGGSTPFTSSNINYTAAYDISPIGIVFSGQVLTVPFDGYYLVEITMNFNSYASSTINLNLYDNVLLQRSLQSEVVVSASVNYGITLSKVVQLLASSNYTIYFVSSASTSISINQLTSGLSIIRLF